MTVAGFDGSGGAGLQADIKTISALGCYATSVLTALPIQNTQGVRAVHPIHGTVVRAQMEAILDDMCPDAIKIGMVHSGELVDAIASTLTAYVGVPIVYDPVLVASSGDTLIKNGTLARIVDRLFPLVTLVTPNMDEASVLAEMPVRTLADMYLAGEKIRQLGVRSVLLKGGHLKTPRLTSIYIDEEGKIHEFVLDKIHTLNTHGTGCTLSSAIASYIALGESVLAAVQKGQLYVHQAILHSSDVKAGKGRGPLNHFFHPQPLKKCEQV